MIFGLHLPFYSYGILMVIAFIAGIGLFAFNCRRCRETMPELIDLTLVITISGVIGSRLLYIVLFPEQFSGIRDYLALHEGGLVFYGGLIASLVSLAIFARCKNLSFRSLADFLAPSLALGHAIGRLGCLIDECCYGTQTSFLQMYRLKSDLPGCYRHPTQLYEAAFLLLMAILLSIALPSRWRRTESNKGLITGFYLIAYSFFRFLIEFIRGDERGGFFTIWQFSPSQLTAILLMAFAAAWIVYCRINSVDSGVKIDEQN